MSKKNIYMWPLILVVILSCSKPVKQDKVLAVVGDKTISVQAFTQRAEFNPERLIGGQKLDKRQLLDLLVDEKLLAIQAEQTATDSIRRIQELVRFVEDLAVMRALFKEKVQNRIKLDSAIVEKSIAFCLQERSISFLAFPDIERATDYRGKWITSSFPAIINELNGPDADTLANSRKVKWGENEAALDETVFALNVGEISLPVQIAGGYVVVRCNDVQYQPLPATTEYNRLKMKVKQVLTARQEAYYSKQYVVGFMSQQQVKFDEQRVRQIMNTLVSLIFDQPDVYKTDMNEIPVDDVLFGQVLQSLSTAQNTLVTFKNGGLSGYDFLKLWRAYHFNVNRESKFVCAKSLNDQFSLVLRDYLLSREGRRLGLDKNSVVKEDVRQWQDYYLAEYMIESKPDSSVMSLLDSLRTNVTIHVDNDLLAPIEFTDIPAIVLRPGQYTSRVTPPLPSLRSR